VLCLSLPLAAQQARLPEARQAELVDPHQAWWFLRPERADSEKPEALLDTLGLKAGDVVADIGAGPGFFSLRAARRVGPTGRVLAVDVQQDMIDGLRRMATQSGAENIVPILGDVDDPKLPDNSVDAALIVISYHEFSHPAEMMRHIHKAMKPDARLLIVEYKAEDPSSRVEAAHKMYERDIVKDLSTFGFRKDKVIDIISAQHVLIFRRDNPVN